MKPLIFPTEKFGLSAANRQMMEWIDKSTRDERNQLLYLETRTVDYDGRVNEQQMNAEDFKITEQMVKDGLVEFGRIYSKHITKQGGHWVRLTDLGWATAALLRRARAERGWQKRQFITTEEKRAA